MIDLVALGLFDNGDIVAKVAFFRAVPINQFNQSPHAELHKHLLKQALFEALHGVDLAGHCVDFSVERGEEISDFLLFL
jgi:hypothetical protein